ncbi:MAG TPA: trehalose-6-phosphate synthase [Methylocella sp.]|nr:trehalose-6-phosphate synthase [Methylocella sp.]
MRLLLRFAIPLLAVLLLMAAALTPLVDKLVGQWFQHDLEIRSRLVFNSINDALPGLLSGTSRQEMKMVFDRIAEDERVLAVGWCGASGQLETTSKSWPRAVGCRPAKPPAPLFVTEHLSPGGILYSGFPVVEGARDVGQLVILHDLSFIEKRSLTARLYLWALLAALGAGSATVTVLTARLTLAGWIRSFQRILNVPASEQGFTDDPQIAPVVSEIRHLLRDLDISRRTAVGIRVDWSPETLRRVLDNELPDVEVVVVSNREPYIHNRDDDGKIVVQRPASGLVTAFEPVMRACGGIWVAHGSGSADRETVDGHDRVAVPPDSPAYRLKRVWLSDEEQNGYYYGLSNEGLWPLCHITFSRPIFRQADWEQYVAVNRKFANVVAKEVKQPDPVILVQDYHFALLPRMLRERLPHATIIAFWHIPWPNPEVFGVCPWREAIIDGLLGSSVIGFHTQLYCNNFIDSADRFIECHIDREDAAISVSGHSAQVRAYPISIAWPPPPLKDLATVQECRANVFQRYDLAPDTMLGVGVERFDYTKGIPDRFRAMEIFLENHPEWVGRFVMLQVAAPTRSRLSLYRDVQEEATALADRINARFGHNGYRPILLVIQHHEPEQVYELFRAADFCIVSSLHDGMNLVAKEFVAARDDEQGVLILSTFAGASRELMEALIINPFDARATANMIEKALRMPRDQQRERMHLMRELVREDNVFYWAGRMLLDAARIRKRHRIETAIAAVSGRKPGGP